MDQEIRKYATQIHNQMQGFYVAGTVPGVRDESEEGPLGEYYDAIYDALRRLRLRCVLEPEDRDVLALLDALEHMLLESGVKMFEYGMKYGQRQE